MYKLVYEKPKLIVFEDLSEITAFNASEPA